jgi:hypothetical protein
MRNEGAGASGLAYTHLVVKLNRRPGVPDRASPAHDLFSARRADTQAVHESLQRVLDGVLRFSGHLMTWTLERTAIPALVSERDQEYMLAVSTRFCGCQTSAELLQTRAGILATDQAKACLRLLRDVYCKGARTGRTEPPKTRVMYIAWACE